MTTTFEVGMCLTPSERERAERMHEYDRAHRDHVSKARREAKRRRIAQQLERERMQQRDRVGHLPVYDLSDTRRSRRRKDTQ